MYERLGVGALDVGAFALVWCDDRRTVRQAMSSQDPAKAQQNFVPLCVIYLKKKKKKATLAMPT